MRCPPERTVPEVLFLARTRTALLESCQSRPVVQSSSRPVVALSIDSCKQKISFQHQPRHNIPTVRPQPHVHISRRAVHSIALGGAVAQAAQGNIALIGRGSIYRLTADERAQNCGWPTAQHHLRTICPLIESRHKPLHNFAGPCEQYCSSEQSGLLLS